MRIPSRHIAKPAEPVKPAEKVIEVKNDNGAILAEVKRVLEVKQKPVKYVFSMIRDSDGLLTQVVASPVDFDTII